MNRGFNYFLLCRGFNNAVNGFGDDGWESTVSDGLDDVTVMLNATSKSLEGQLGSDKLLYSLGGGILCAKASMLLQVQPSDTTLCCHLSSYFYVEAFAKITSPKII